MKKKSKLSLDRRVLRQLSPREVRETAGGYVGVPVPPDTILISCMCVPWPGGPLDM